MAKATITFEDQPDGSLKTSFAGETQDGGDPSFAERVSQVFYVKITETLDQAEKIVNQIDDIVQQGRLPVAANGSDQLN